MKISEFADSRGIKQQTVYKYISRHKWKYDTELGLTDEQFTQLDQKYPLPKPVTIINGLSHDEERQLREELNAAKEQLVACQALIIELQNKQHDIQLQLSDAQHRADILAIEDRYHTQQIEDLKCEKERLQEDLDNERRKTWWDKLRGK